MKEQNREKQERWLAGECGVVSEQFEGEILKDSGLSEEIYSAMELTDALSEAAQRGVVGPHAQRPFLGRRWAWATGLAAAMLAFVLIMPQLQKPDQNTSLRLRGAGGVGSAVCFEPLGELDHFPRTFSWHPANPDSPARFRWELYDAGANRRGIAVVQDTTLLREGALTPADSIGTWLWLVIELKPDGLEGPTSAAVQFTVKPEGDH